MTSEFFYITDVEVFLSKFILATKIRWKILFYFYYEFDSFETHCGTPSQRNMFNTKLKTFNLWRSKTVNNELVSATAKLKKKKKTVISCQ